MQEAVPARRSWIAKEPPLTDGSVSSLAMVVVMHYQVVLAWVPLQARQLHHLLKDVRIKHQADQPLAPPFEVQWNALLVVPSNLILRPRLIFWNRYLPAVQRLDLIQDSGPA